MFPLGILWPVVVTHEIIHHHYVPFCFLLCQDYGDYLFHSVWWHCPPKDSSCNLMSAVCLGKSVILSLLKPGSESLHRPATSLGEPLWLTIWGNFRSEQPFPLTWPNRTQMGRFTSFSWCLQDGRAASIMASGEPSAWVLTVVKDRLYSLPRTPRSWGTKMRLMCGTVHSLGKPNSPKMNTLRALRTASGSRAQLGLKCRPWLLWPRHKILVFPMCPMWMPLIGPQIFSFPAPPLRI